MDRLESVANALNVPIDLLTSENVVPTNEIIIGKNIKKIFATNIKKIREQCNLTQEQFGEKLGVTISTVSDWEKAKSLPLAGVIEKISTEFNIHEKYSTSPYHRKYFIRKWCTSIRRYKRL